MKDIKYGFKTVKGNLSFPVEWLIEPFNNYVNICREGIPRICSDWGVGTYSRLAPFLSKIGSGWQRFRSVFWQYA